MDAGWSSVLVALITSTGAVLVALIAKEGFKRSRNGKLATRVNELEILYVQEREWRIDAEEKAAKLEVELAQAWERIANR